jgi:Mn-containing catalase
MSNLKDLFVEELQDILHAETQLLGALPKMAAAAHAPALKEGFEKHLAQTQIHVERLQRVFELLDVKANSTPCKAMMGLVEEGEETIKDGKEKAPLVADLALITAAQKVEHYEIAAYGTLRGLARQIGEIDAATLLSHTLGDEEAADFLLTSVAKPLLQQATLEHFGADVNLQSIAPKANRTKEKGRKVA